MVVRLTGTIFFYPSHTKTHLNTIIFEPLFASNQFPVLCWKLVASGRKVARWFSRRVRDLKWEKYRHWETLTFDDYSHFNSQCGSWIYIHSIIEIDISCNLAAYYNASLVIIELIIKNVYIACAKKWNSSKWADINQFWGMY